MSEDEKQWLIDFLLCAYLAAFLVITFVPGVAEAANFLGRIWSMLGKLQSGIPN